MDLKEEIDELKREWKARRAMTATCKVQGLFNLAQTHYRTAVVINALIKRLESEDKP